MSTPGTGRSSWFSRAGPYWGLQTGVAFQPLVAYNQATAGDYRPVVYYAEIDGFKLAGKGYNSNSAAELFKKR